MFNKPVIIVGAPRSGTSLLQKIIREHPSFVSVPRESDIIWNRYCHPSLQEYDKEGIADELITSEVIAAIRRAFEDAALPASAWQRWSGWGLMNHPLSSALVRKVYSPAFKVFTLLRRLQPKRSDSSNPSRLVDKSVHCALWLNLVEAVFPDALYIHITRDARQTLDSMIDGWLDPERFNTFSLPQNLQVQGYSGQSWSFCLPAGWRNYVEAPLEKVVAFQWRSIQQAILDHLSDSSRKKRYIHVRLEDLVANPSETLQKIASFIEVSEDFKQYCNGVPVVNASTNRQSNEILRYPDAVERVMPLVESLQHQFGY